MGHERLEFFAQLVHLLLEMLHLGLQALNVGGGRAQTQGGSLGVRNAVRGGLGGGRAGRRLGGGLGLGLYGRRVRLFLRLRRAGEKGLEHRSLLRLDGNHPVLRVELGGGPDGGNIVPRRLVGIGGAVLSGGSRILPCRGGLLRRKGPEALEQEDEAPAPGRKHSQVHQNPCVLEEKHDKEVYRNFYLLSIDIWMKSIFREEIHLHKPFMPGTYCHFSNFSMRDLFRNL
jgi:hypothetical protein